MEYVCKACGMRESVFSTAPRCACGGLWQLDFAPPAFDLAKVDRDCWSMFRYRAFLPLIDGAWRDVSLGEGMTPLVPMDGHLLLKLDYCMPTLSFKDRGAAMLIAHAKSIGVDRVVQDSSGNAGNAVAAYCAKAGIACEIYVPEGASSKKIDMIRAHGALCHVVPGTRDHCADVCRERVDRDGVYYANHVYNPFFYEGTKTYLLEVYEQLRRLPSHILVPVGNGTLFLGVMKAIEALLAAGLIEQAPQVIVVQSERYDPFVRAVRAGSRVPARVQPARTLAEGIAIGEPARGEELLSCIYKYGVHVLSVPEADILPARAALARMGVYCEHTTAANYAGYLAYAAAYGQPDECLLPMCGAGLKSDH